MLSVKCDTSKISIGTARKQIISQKGSQSFIIHVLYLTFSNTHQKNSESIFMMSSQQTTGRVLEIIECHSIVEPRHVYL